MIRDVNNPPVRSKEGVRWKVSLHFVENRPPEKYPYHCASQKIISGLRRARILDIPMSVFLYRIFLRLFNYTFMIKSSISLAERKPFNFDCQQTYSLEIGRIFLYLIRNPRQLVEFLLIKIASTRRLRLAILNRSHGNRPRDTEPHTTTIGLTKTILFSWVSNDERAQTYHFTFVFSGALLSMPQRGHTPGVIWSRVNIILMLIFMPLRKDALGGSDWSKSLPVMFSSRAYFPWITILCPLSFSK